MKRKEFKPDIMSSEDMQQNIEYMFTCYDIWTKHFANELQDVWERRNWQDERISELEDKIEKLEHRTKASRGAVRKMTEQRVEIEEKAYCAWHKAIGFDHDTLSTSEREAWVHRESYPYKEIKNDEELERVKDKWKKKGWKVYHVKLVALKEIK